jgi:hypothetical protein
MVVFGGMNDFNQIMNDLAVYDLDKNVWIDDIKIKNSSIIPLISHSSGVTIFHETRHLV